MFKIAVANEKGGVAKTTSTVSLAAGLAETGKKVLLLDLDAQANTTLSVGLDPTVCKNTIFDTLIRSMDVAEIILPTNIPNISIIPANHDVGLIEQNLPRLSDYECRLRNALATVNGQFDFAIFDCPPFLGSVTINAITASNLLMIPTQAEFFSIYALSNLMQLIRKIRSMHNPGLTYRLLITMFDRRNRIHRVLYQQLQDNFSMGLLQTIIETDTRLRESPGLGKTVFQHSPRTRATLQYRALSQEILDYMEDRKN